MPEDLDADDSFERAQTPSRAMEWETPFPSVRGVNADADATRPVTVFSARRRVVAIIVSVLAAAWVADIVWGVVRFTNDAGGSIGRVFGVVGAAVVIVRLVIAAVVCFFVWGWAQRPVSV